MVRRAAICDAHDALSPADRLDGYIGLEEAIESCFGQLQRVSAVAGDHTAPSPEVVDALCETELVNAAPAVVAELYEIDHAASFNV